MEIHPPGELERLRPLDYPQTDVFLVFWSIDSLESLENIFIKWLPEIRKHQPEPTFIVVGAKFDLRDDASFVRLFDTNQLKMLNNYLLSYSRFLLW